MLEGKRKEWRTCPYVRTRSGDRLPIAYMARKPQNWVLDHRSIPDRLAKFHRRAKRRRKLDLASHELGEMGGELEYDPEYEFQATTE